MEMAVLELEMVVEPALSWIKMNYALAKRICLMTSYMAAITT